MTKHPCAFGNFCLTPSALALGFKPWWSLFSGFQISFRIEISLRLTASTTGFSLFRCNLPGRAGSRRPLLHADNIGNSMRKLDFGSSSLEECSRNVGFLTLRCLRLVNLRGTATFVPRALLRKGPWPCMLPRCINTSLSLSISWRAVLALPAAKNFSLVLVLCCTFQLLMTAPPLTKAACHLSLLKLLLTWTFPIFRAPMSCDKVAGVVPRPSCPARGLLCLPCLLQVVLRLAS